MAKTKFKTGNVDVPAENFDRKKTKIRISMWVDGEMLDAYRVAAQATPHGEYQTLMKEALRDYLAKPFRGTIEQRVAKLEAQAAEGSRIQVVFVPYISTGVSSPGGMLSETKVTLPQETTG